MFNKIFARIASQAKKLPAPSAGASRAVADADRQQAVVPVNPNQVGGRLVFVVDATNSRSGTLRETADVQGALFEAAGEYGTLAMQLVFFQGDSIVQKSPWVTKAEEMQGLFNAVSCKAGHTQIVRALDAALAPQNGALPAAVIYVGDHAEEKPDDLMKSAGRYRAAGVPLFIFHDLHNPEAHAVVSTFRMMADYANGAYAPFTLDNVSRLRDMLRTVAAYATGGKTAVARLAPTSEGARQIAQAILALPAPRP